MQTITQQNVYPEITVTNVELADLVNQILADPTIGGLKDREKFERFCSDIALILCVYGGGHVVRSPALRANKTALGEPFNITIQMDRAVTKGSFWNLIKNQESKAAEA